jgi:hypothetical protein
MALKPHPSFSPALDPAAPLWRYMGLPKYLALLQQKALFFSNLELMARGDPFEGALPRERFQHRAWSSIADVPSDIRESLRNSMRPGEADLLPALNRYKDLRELRIRQAYAYRRSYFINCWHLSSHESAAMWDIYSRRDEGIAIVSSEQRIAEALEASELDVYGGRVIYGDYDDEDFVIEDTNGFNPVLRKRQSFSYEAEYRLVFWDTDLTHKKIHAVNGIFDWDGKRFLDDTHAGTTTVPRTEDEIERIEPRSGVQVACDLDCLVDRVYVSPLAPEWFFNVVQDVSRTYRLKVPIRRSELFAQPPR